MQRLKTLLVLLFLAMPASFAADLKSADLKHLSQIENKFFAHDYPTDPIEDRLERVEKFVFGAAKPGSDEDRLAELVKTMGVTNLDKPEVADSDTGDSQSSASSKKTKRKNAVASSENTEQKSPQIQDTDQNIAQKSDQQEEGNQPPPKLSSQHPRTDEPKTGEEPPSATAKDLQRVANLEIRIIGDTNTDQPIDERVDRLEIKGLGKATDIDNLEDRITNLEKHYPEALRMPRIAKSNGSSRGQSDYPSSGSYGFGGGSSPSYGRSSYGSSSNAGMQDDDDSQNYNPPPSKSRTAAKKHSDWTPDDELEMGSNPQSAMANPQSGYQDDDSSGYGSSNTIGMGMGSGSSFGSNGFGGGSSFGRSSSTGFGTGAFFGNSGSGGGRNYDTFGYNTKPPKQRKASNKHKQPLDMEADQMEKEVLGKTYGKDPLLDRLTRLEKAVFPQSPASSDMNIPDRFDRLANALGPMDPANTTADMGSPNSYGSGYSNQANLDNAKKGGFLNGIGRALGSAFAGFESASMNPYGYGYSSYGSPYGGYSPYGGLGGFGSPYGGGFGSPFGGGFGSPFGGIGGFGSPYGGNMMYPIGYGANPYARAPLGSTIGSPFFGGSPFGGSPFGGIGGFSGFGGGGTRVFLP